MSSYKSYDRMWTKQYRFGTESFISDPFCPGNRSQNIKKKTYGNFFNFNLDGFDVKLEIVG